MSAGCENLLSKPLLEEVLLEKIGEHLGVKYVYEEKSQKPVSGRDRSTEDLRQKAQEISPKADLVTLFSQLSETWAAQLYHAAAQCSDTLIFDLLEQIYP